MKKDKILITINNLDDIKALKELGIKNYAFPLKGYSVGIPNTFSMEEIKEEGYLFINRILDNKGIDDLKKELNSIPSNIKGIIFDDLGVYEIIKNKNIEKILYLTHFNTNKESINLWLNYVDNLIISTDITKDEIEYIINNTNKDVSLFVFGYVSSMYSRRLLLDNYNKFYNTLSSNPLTITNDNISFKVYENPYGTVFYYDKIFNGLELMNIKAKYYFINSVFLSIDDIKNILNNNIDYLNTDDGFLHKKTIYKLEGE